MLVVLVPRKSAEPRLGPESVRRLSRLGVTEVSVLRDETTIGVVLQGWTFDPIRCGPEAAAAAGGPAARLLLPVMEAAVSWPVPSRQP